MTLLPMARLDRGLGCHARTRRRPDVVRRLQLVDHAPAPVLAGALTATDTNTADDVPSAADARLRVSFSSARECQLTARVEKSGIH